MRISYENMILNKSKILHLHNYAKEKVLKSFEMNPWNLLAHGQQLGLEIHFPLTKIHLPRVTGILENWCSIWHHMQKGKAYKNVSYFEIILFNITWRRQT